MGRTDRSILGVEKENLGPEEFRAKEEKGETDQEKVEKRRLQSDVKKSWLKRREGKGRPDAWPTPAGRCSGARYSKQGESKVPTA